MLFLNIFFLLLLCAESIQASPQPLEIRASQIICEKDKGFCIAEGDAIAILGKDNDPLKQTLSSDTLKVFFETSQGKSVQKEDEVSSMAGGSKLKRVEVHGHVKLERGDLIIFSEKGNYDTGSDVVTFRENVKIKDGEKSYAECSVATYDRKTNVYEIKEKAKILVYAKT